MKEIEETNMDIHSNKCKIFESEKRSSKQSIQCKTHQCEHIIFARCNNPTVIPSYEMSTLASRLKHSTKSYFNRFNSQNIPFVVGTSATPSHNLGINMQQVLSLIKMRQLNVDSINPLLIRKMVRGTKTVSVFLKQMNRQREKSVPHPSSQMIKILNDKKNLIFSQEMISERSNKICRQFYKEKGDLDENNKIEQLFPPVENKNDPPANVENVQGQDISRMLLNKKDNIGDHITHIASSHNFMAIRDVLINLHNQFEEMNTKYEKLQLKVQKTDNKILAKQLSTLEKELNMKEEEINIVITLYKKIMLKSSHEENNLMYIVTDSSTECHQNSFPTSDTSKKSCLTNTTQVFGRKEENVHNRIIRKPPISMQLATLLRQIQAFYKQLQLIS